MKSQPPMGGHLAIPQNVTLYTNEPLITITWVSRLILMQNLMLQKKVFIKRDVGQCSLYWNGLNLYLYLQILH